MVESENLITYSFSADSDYHTQRNNVYIPFASCGRTSMVMALVQAGWGEDFLKVMEANHFDGQEEDYLYEVLHTDAAKDHFKTLLQAGLIDSWALMYSYDEIHLMLDWAVNEVLGKSVSRFNPNSSDQQVVTALFNGTGVGLAGQFKNASGETLEHIVSVGGAVLTEAPFELSGGGRMVQVRTIKNWLIDDPYGNPWTGYSDIHGNNVPFTPEQFTSSFINRTNSPYLWAHFIRPKVLV